MNLPNMLTLFRVVLVPIMVVLYYIDNDPMVLNAESIAIGVCFIIGSFTDYLDGYIARKKNIITILGKFLDPLADKLFVMFALLMLLANGVVPMWVVLIILSREFIVTGIRLVAAADGSVIVAGQLGKYKTAVTMVALVLLLFHFETIGLIILYIGLVLTVVSGFEYFIKNKSKILVTK